MYCLNIKINYNCPEKNLGRSTDRANLPVDWLGTKTKYVSLKSRLLELRIGMANGSLKIVFQNQEGKAVAV